MQIRPMTVQRYREDVAARAEQEPDPLGIGEHPAVGLEHHARGPARSRALHPFERLPMQRHLASAEDHRLAGDIRGVNISEHLGGLSVALVAQLSAVLAKAASAVAA